MPLCRINEKLIYFAHVPKAAGTAIEDYLQERFGPLALLDRLPYKEGDQRQWASSSPQHMDALVFKRFFPQEFVDASFAIVRHPAPRLRSMFRFHRDISQQIPRKTSFSAWLNGLAALRADNPFYLDNHARPMVEFIPDGSEVFRVEDGLDRVIQWLDELAGNKNGAREIRPRNTRSQNIRRLKRENAVIGAPVELDDQNLADIERLYTIDYERFGYTKDFTDSMTGDPVKKGVN